VAAAVANSGDVAGDLGGANGPVKSEKLCSTSEQERPRMMRRYGEMDFNLSSMRWGDGIIHVMHVNRKKRLGLHGAFWLDAASNVFVELQDLRIMTAMVLDAKKDMKEVKI